MPEPRRRRVHDARPYGRARAARAVRAQGTHGAAALRRARTPSRAASRAFFPLRIRLDVDVRSENQELHRCQYRYELHFYGFVLFVTILRQCYAWHCYYCKILLGLLYVSSLEATSEHVIP